MLGPNRTPQYILLVMTVVFGILLIGLQVVRRYKVKPKNETQAGGGPPVNTIDRSLWICELLTAISLIVLVAVNFGLYLNYIPADSPGCLPYISKFGVIASQADPSKFAISPPASFPATSYIEAVKRYHGSPNGLATGYFSWDGLTVTILNSNAHQLASGAPQGTSWVFQDLSTAAAR